MDGEVARPVVADAPRGIHAARVDEKGRLKLPAVFHQYLNELGEKKVFITALDNSSVRLYPIAVWKENEAVLRRSANPKAAAQAILLANYYGADSEIDNQGRVLLPQLLRRERGLENQPVLMSCLKGRIDVHSKEQVERDVLIAKANADANNQQLEAEGFQ